MAYKEEQSVEGKVISIDPEEDVSFAPENLNMVGKILSDKEVSFSTCKAAIMGIWGHPQGVAISDVGRNKVLISFKDARKGIHIRNGGPWSIRGNLLNLQTWNGRESIYEVDHRYMELWIQIHGLPLNYITRKTAEIIGKKIGAVMETENPRLNDTLQRTFLRVRVTMNITKPLPTGFWLATQNHQTVWVDFKYERIQDSYCLNCGILGHTKKECKNPMAMASWDHTKPRYGLGLGVSRARAILAKETEQDDKAMNREWSEAKQDCEGERVRMQCMKDQSEAESGTGRGLEAELQRDLKANSEQQAGLDRESQGSRQHVEDVLQNVLIKLMSSHGKALRRGDKSPNIKADITKGKDKLQEVGEVNSAFMPNATLSREQQGSRPCKFQSFKEGCQEHLQVGENMKHQPFGTETRLNEGHFNELKQMEVSFECQQVQQGASEYPKKLTIREELEMLFGKKEPQIYQYGVMDFNKQSEKETRIIKHGGGQLWSYREKLKMKRTITAAGRTMIQRMENGEEYYVELAEEKQDMKEQLAAVSEQRNENQHVLELAFDMGLNLNAKRRRDTSSLPVYVDKMEDDEQLIMEKSGKKFKDETGTVVAEEAGLIMPHQQP